jgi:hypothetical protein
MGVILSCKTSKGQQCRTSGEERTSGAKGIRIPPQCSNGKENQNDTKSRSTCAVSGARIVGAGSSYHKSTKRRTDVELPRKTGLPNLLGLRGRSGEQKVSSFLSDFFSPKDTISRDENLKLKPSNPVEPQVLQPINFFLVLSSRVENRNHPSPNDLSSYLPNTILGNELNKTNIGKIAFSDSVIRTSTTPNGTKCLHVLRGNKLIRSASVVFSVTN